MSEWLLIKSLTVLQLMGMRKTGPKRRGQHPKHHGCVTCDFTIAENIPDHLRVGVFAKPDAYKAVIRFSNGAKDDDWENDVHGMAIKLLDVDGRKILEGEEDETTQDFILADNPVFLAKNVWHLIQFAFIKKFKRIVRRTHPAYEGFSKPASSSPLATHYWSQTPYRLGTAVVRYEAHPAQGNSSGNVNRSLSDFLRLAMASFLKEGTAHFDFVVQTAPDDNVKWCEDPTLPWYGQCVKVATITIPPQQFDTPEKQKFAEDLSYTPWHSLSEHEPLGQINRARKVVYRASSRKRHKLTGGETKEPTVNDV